MTRSENIVNYKDIGQVRYVSNKKAKNLSIRINRLGEVRVTVPLYMSHRKAEKFVRSKQAWIRRKREEIREKQEGSLILKEGDLLRVRGKSIPVLLKDEKDSLEEAVWRILLEEARACLPQRVAELAKQYGFTYSGVKVRKMQSRWGSCSARNSINLNSWLIMLPDHLSDYVILHELAHTKYHDHGPEFWSRLDRMTGGRSKDLRKELREKPIMLIHPEKDLGGKGDGIEGMA